MKITAFLATCSFLICFPVLAFATDELVMQKEVMYWTVLPSDTACSELIKIEVGRDVPDMRDELCGYVLGTFNVTLSGPGCVKTQITDVILRDKFSLFYNSRSSYFELADFVDTDSIL